MDQPREAPARRGRQIHYHVAVDGEPSADLLLANYIWCLQQRESDRTGPSPVTPAAAEIAPGASIFC